MANSPYVFDASMDNFPRLVLENSAKGPVLVNYWLPKAGPCLMLMPRLVRLASEFGGRFLLVMFNTDELSQLARSHGVVSLPTIKVYRHGKVVDTLHGAESESVLRTHVSILRTAREAPSLTELEQAIATNPDNLEARYQLSAVQLVANDYDAAMHQLLEIAKRRPWLPPRRRSHGLQALVELLGENDERVLRYRALLQAAMH
jgi:thioredoxin-like negative regulator of GroEL